MHEIAAACGKLGIIVTQICLFFRDVLREHLAKGDMGIHSLFFRDLQRDHDGIFFWSHDICRLDSHRHWLNLLAVAGRNCIDLQGRLFPTKNNKKLSVGLPISVRSLLCQSLDRCSLD